MTSIKMKAEIVCSLLISYLSTTVAIKCYQCKSTDLHNPYQCNEFMEDSELQPLSCDSVYNAAYCIKQTGRFEASAIVCYDCDSRYNTDCSDILIHDTDNPLDYTPCNANARYCIKTTGYYEGGLGTRRFCSSLDLGNYCNFIQQPGDQLEYRSCIYTCDSDGCNNSSFLLINLNMVVLPFILYYVAREFRGV